MWIGILLGLPTPDCVVENWIFFPVSNRCCLIFLYFPPHSTPSGVSRRQFLVNILLDVMVQDTGFTVSFKFIKFYY